MRNKCGIIERTEQLHSLLDGYYRTNNEEGVLGAGNPYLAVGCDLRNLKSLKATLQDAVDIEDDSVLVLFVAEVSLAYMEADASQALLEWTATYHDVRFCLLEQHLPDGADHPFARTMLAHFQKLSTPLHTIGTIDAMKQRFVVAAWPESGIDCRSLWELWSDPTMLSPEQRRTLDAIEPFDEWEEFALFASHYFLLQAERKADQDYVSKSYRHSMAASRISVASEPISSNGSDADAENVLHVQEFAGPQVPRRFAAIVPPATRGQDGDAVGLHGGMGTSERLGDCDTYSWFQTAQHIDGPPLRHGLMCHTITRLGGTNNCILVGGRTSPDKALADCWLRHNEKWEKVQSLPKGRFRHCAVPVRLPTEPRPAHTLIVYGGRTSDGQVLDEWLLWSEETGWQILRVAGEAPSPRFGAAMITDHEEGISGVIIGGMTSAGRVLSDFWHWSLQPDMSILCHNVTARATAVLKNNAGILGRFGAQMVRSEHGILLVGGITGGRMLTRHDEILNMRTLRPIPVKTARPLFVGTCMQDVDGGLLMLGGGATCFSFGTYWSKSCFLSFMAQSRAEQSWQLIHSKQAEVKRTIPRPHSLQGPPATSRLPPPATNQSQSSSSGELDRTSSFTSAGNQEGATHRVLHLPLTSHKSMSLRSNSIVSSESSYFVEAPRPPHNIPRKPASVSTGRSVSPISTNGHGQGLPLPLPVSVPRVQLVGHNNFMKYLDASQPVIMSSLSLGECTQRWSNEYLEGSVGSNRNVVVHSSKEETMDFQEKNFTYNTIGFGPFLDAIERGEKLYLRSLSKEAPKAKPANIREDFPEIANDFSLPVELSYVMSNLHSSPLRISGPVTMWLHYDVMDNVLCQIRGKKRVVLFPPSDIGKLDFAPGASSSSLNVLAPTGGNPASLKDMKPYEAILKPGEVLFIPSMWAHTAAPMDGVSVSVNCFFRSMEGNKYAAGRDVYGNRDLAAYEKGRKDVATIIRSFDELPAHVSAFYLQRLGMELLDKAKATAASAGEQLHSVYAELG